MKAIVNESYGSPEVMQLKEVEKPLPASDEILIRVRAASVNPLDGHLLSGMPPVRLTLGLFKPKHKILGADVAGIVESIGEEITNFQIGDEVYGDAFKSGLGGFAEYVTLKEDQIVKKPANLTFEQAASLPVAALTALNALRSFGEIEKDSKVLINGASGGVGTMAIQMAKAFGAEVTGVCSTNNVELIKSLGADHAIDYTRDDLYKHRYDLIIDNVGNLSLANYKSLMKPHGHSAIVGFDSLRQMISGMLLGGKSIKSVHVKAKNEDLLYINDLIHSGKIKPVIDRVYPLAETADALTYVKTRHAKGKVIIIMNQSNHGTL